MNVKLDKKDLKIVTELDRDCRLPLKELAARIGGAVETTRYRIRRLEEIGVIKNYLTVINGGRLGFYYYKVFFRLHNVKENNVQQMMLELAADPRICWVIRTHGNFDIGFTPRVSNPAEQSELLDTLRTRYSQYLKRWTLSVNIRMDFFSRDYLLGVSRRKKIKNSYVVSHLPLTLDRIGSSVLRELAANPRSSASAIAERLRVSVDTVLARVRMLEKEMVIVRHSLVTDVRILGHVNYYVLVYLSNVTAKREADFCAFCALQPNIVYLIKALGDWDYELSIEAPTFEEYRRVLMELTHEFDDIIDECNGMLVEEIKKYVYP